MSHCDHSYIPITLTFSGYPVGCFARCVKTGKHVIRRTRYTNTRSFVCLYASRILRSFFALFNRFDRCLHGSLLSLVLIAVSIYFNRLQNTRALKLCYFCIWNFISEAFFWLPWVALNGPLINRLLNTDGLTIVFSLSQSNQNKGSFCAKLLSVSYIYFIWKRHLPWGMPYLSMHPTVFFQRSELSPLFKFIF